MDNNHVGCMVILIEYTFRSKHCAIYGTEGKYSIIKKNRQLIQYEED